MNKICVIAKNFDTTFIKRLTSTLSDNCYESFNPWVDEIVPEADFYLVRTTSVYGDDRDLRVIEKLPPHKVINPLGMLKLCRTKLNQYERFPEISPRFLDLERSSFEKAHDFFLNEFKGKGVVKPHRGQGGWGVKILQGEEFKTWWESSTDREFLLQEYIEGEEIRVFFIQDKFFGLKRFGEKGIANHAQGGEARPFIIEEGLKASLKELIKETGAHYGAFDLIFKDRYYLLELNSVPGIEQIEEVLKVDLISLLTSSLPSKVAIKLKL